MADTLFGQGGCTDYDVATSAGNTIVAGTADIGNHGDDVATNIALPFTFTYYTQSFNSVNVSSNGNLQFTSSNTAFTNVCPLPDNTMNYPIFPYWEDMRTDNLGFVGCAGYSGGLCGIFTSISGVAPDRIFNIEWRAVYFAATASPANFEVRLHETTNQIDLIYGATTGNSSATGGLQEGTGPAIEDLFCNGSGQAVTSGLGVSYSCVAGPCQLTCPLDVIQGNDPDQCGAVVTYSAPTTTGTCGTVACLPPSGSFFPVAPTQVTCTETPVTGGQGASCLFNVTVSDAQPPAITCPADINEDLPSGVVSGPANWLDPVVSDNCPGVGFPNCVPPSGSTFQADVLTPVSCTVLDAASNTGNCTFNVLLASVSIIGIPTASGWGLAGLALLLAGAAFLALRRSKA